jgi:hypothetical protein
MCFVLIQNLKVARPMSPGMKRPHTQIQNFERYIFCSTAPTENYFTESVNGIQGMKPFLHSITGKSTSRYCLFASAKEQHRRIERGIRWLQANRGLSAPEIGAK